jgi:HEPN domain-containing protein
MDANFKEGSAFMCQQSVEKALKGFLVFNKIRVAKPHDLVEHALDRTQEIYLELSRVVLQA